jgi:hypothetical protein
MVALVGVLAVTSQIIRLDAVILAIGAWGASAACHLVVLGGGRHRVYVLAPPLGGVVESRAKAMHQHFGAGSGGMHVSYPSLEALSVEIHPHPCGGSRPPGEIPSFGFSGWR